MAVGQISYTVLIKIQVRMAAAGTLWTLTNEDALKLQDWSLPSKSLKPVVDSIKSNMTRKIMTA